MAKLVDYEVTAPDGTELIVTGPEGATDEEITSQAMKLYGDMNTGTLNPEPKVDDVLTPQKDYTDVGLGQVGKEAVLGFIPSAGRELSNLWDVVSSPIETAKTVAQLGYGVLQNVLPDNIVQLMGDDEESQQLASSVGEYIADRYGGIENIKRTVATDSAGFAADIAGIFSGGATIAAKVISTGAKVAGKTSKFAAVPSMLQSFADKVSLVDPVTLGLVGAGKAGKLGLTKVIGPGLGKALAFTSGTGEEAVKQAYKSGRVGGDSLKAFRDNLTGKADPLEIVQDARSNLDILYAQRKKEYIDGKAGLKDVTLNLQTIRNALEYAESTAGVSPKVNKALADVRKILDDASNKNYKTVSDFDDLKRAINDIAMDYRGSSAGSQIDTIQRLIKKQITDVDPQYDIVMKSYADATKYIKEMEISLSLEATTGQRKTADASLKKLLSVMRDGVSTNYGQKFNMAQQLEQLPNAKQILPQLAGQELSSYLPRGIQGRIMSAGLTGAVGYMGGGLLSPSAVVSGLAASPRAVGNAAQLAGRTARRSDQVMRKAAQMLPSATPSYLGMFDRATEEEGN